MDSIINLIKENYKDIISLALAGGGIIFFGKYGDDYRSNLEKFVDILKKFSLALILGVYCLIINYMVCKVFSYNFFEGIKNFIKNILNIILFEFNDFYFTNIENSFFALIVISILVSMMIISVIPFSAFTKKYFVNEYEKKIKNLPSNKVPNRIQYTLEILTLITVALSWLVSNQLIIEIISKKNNIFIITILSLFLFCIFYNFYQLKILNNKLKIINLEARFVILLENDRAYYCNYYFEKEKKIVLYYDSSIVELNRDKYIQIERIDPTKVGEIKNNKTENIFIKAIKFTRKVNFYRYIIL